VKRSGLYWKNTCSDLAWFHSYHLVVSSWKIDKEIIVDPPLFQGEKIPVGTKPCLLFVGEPFETDYEYKRLKNLFIGKSHFGMFAA
jgi:hypothetical protein